MSLTYQADVDVRYVCLQFSFYFLHKDICSKWKAVESLHHDKWISLSVRFCLAVPSRRLDLLPYLMQCTLDISLYPPNHHHKIPQKTPHITRVRANCMVSFLVHRLHKVFALQLTAIYRKAKVSHLHPPGFNIVNIMVADSLAPCVARTSAPMILTM